MSQTYLRGNAAALHRIDLSCEQAGFTTPPFDVHIKVLPSPASGGWTLLAHAAAGKPALLARWFEAQAGIERVQVGPGLAPKVLRATTHQLPPAWVTLASLVKVNHLDLAADGQAAWFIEGVRAQVLAAVQLLGGSPSGMASAATGIRCRPVHLDGLRFSITRRQFEALALAVALGYYEIPHGLDLRSLAKRTGVSLGSVSELLRRAEGAILTHYVDARLMVWPEADEDVAIAALPETLRPRGPPERSLITTERVFARGQGAYAQVPYRA